MHLSGYFCPTVEPVATEEGRNEEEDEIFQIRLFLSTSLFQKSKTTQCFMVSGCFELLQLLNGSSFTQPTELFHSGFITLLKSLSWMLRNRLSKPLSC